MSYPVVDNFLLMATGIFSLLAAGILWDTEITWEDHRSFQIYVGAKYITDIH